MLAREPPEGPEREERRERGREPAVGLRARGRGRLPGDAVVVAPRVIVGDARRVEEQGAQEERVAEQRQEQQQRGPSGFRKIKSCDDLVEAVRNSNGRGQGGRAWGTRLPG